MDVVVNDSWFIKTPGILVNKTAYLPLSFFILLSGCFAPQVIPISYISGNSSPTVSQSSDYRTQAAAIASVLVSELKLPRFESVLYVYFSLNDFKIGLVKEAEDLTGSAPQNGDPILTVAGCSNKKILAYWPSRVPWAMRVKSLAHEMTHLAHFALGNWRCSRREHAWLMEGFANWMAFRTLERLSVNTFKAEHDEFLNGVRTFSNKQAFPSLKLLSPYRDWLNMLDTYEYSGTYQQSFFAVDYLIERNGLNSVVKYFTLFEHSADADKNFKAAFGIEFTDFETDFRGYFTKLSG
jgi:hypothetical protein